MTAETKNIGLSIDAIRQAIADGKTTASALAGDLYAGIAKNDPEIGAFLTLTEDRAFAQAAHIDKIAADGKPLPPLAGVPIAIKDVMVMRGVRTTAGSKILESFISPYDCTAVARLEAAGAVVLGKLNCDEFAMGSSNENSAFHPVRNPRDKTRVPEDRREDRQRPLRQEWRSQRSGPIPADQSGSQRRFAASWA